ncbi:MULTISPECIES: ribonuclease HII [Microbacterium]|uniref:Ribonuclease n=1 Tax=Microbacterium aurugineum TaxID=2851642 RepID=A0ABY4IYR1_9MICO|nr:MULTISPECIES: ribonuclease HII [Microbacterium]MCE0507960.1 ribonuclease HII [Microbacterium sp. KKR3/1]MCK8466131.1 ribonuclease HII [Microbacterium aurugineum]MCK8477476.1 ribonuclease HII [Microbacterium aurugineum]TCJ29632.1 ribonuclease HII [Microbacterium sp. PI-1]UPL17827.1 ribonuclease HII [Microbacterium aurugineum]
MTVITPKLTLERRLLRECELIISLDEVGRGALAGPVAVGAAMMDATGARRRVPEGLRDSKLVTERRRPEVAERAAAWVQASAVGWATAQEVDDIGIMSALGLAASRAVQSIADQGATVEDALILLDGNHDYVSRIHPVPLRVRPVIKADRDCASVSAASVIAKVARDGYMAELHETHSAYQWNRNKGYASPEHRDAIRSHGLSPFHRASWAIADVPTLF